MRGEVQAEGKGACLSILFRLFFLTSVGVTDAHILQAHGSPMACLELLTQLKRDDAITFSPNNTTAFVRPTTSLTDPSLDSGRSSRKKSASNNDAFANNLLDSLPVAMQMVLKCGT